MIKCGARLRPPRDAHHGTGGGGAAGPAFTLVRAALFAMFLAGEVVFVVVCCSMYVLDGWV